MGEKEKKLKDLCIFAKHSIDKILSYSLLSSTPTPPPLQVGDWVLVKMENKSDENIIVTETVLLKKKYQHTWTYLTLDGVEKTEFHQHFTSHTLTKDDLPDGWEYKKLHYTGMSKVTKLLSEQVSIEIVGVTPKTAISEALKLHILRNSDLGQRLFKKAGG